MTPNWEKIKADIKEIVDGAFGGSFQTPNEFDANGEVPNVVDGLYYIGRSIAKIAVAVDRLAEAVEKHG